MLVNIYLYSGSVNNYQCLLRLFRTNVKDNHWRFAIGWPIYTMILLYSKINRWTKKMPLMRTMTFSAYNELRKKDMMIKKGNIRDKKILHMENFYNTSVFTLRP